MKYTLRPYQQEAVSAFFSYAENNSPVRTLISAPTGSGKSLLIAEIVKRAQELSNKPIYVLQHRKELIEQNAEKLTSLGVSCSLYSAGIGIKKISKVTVASIQSIFKKDCPVASLIIVDEAHLIPPDGEGMYRTFLDNMVAKNPKVKLLGLTATPFRTKTGSLLQDDGLFDSQCYNIDMRILIKDGYLCPLVSKGALNHIETADIKIRSKEFAAEEVEKKYDAKKINQIFLEIRRLAFDRKHILVFCPTVESAEVFTNALTSYQETAHCITGNTLFRENFLNDFRNNKIRFLCNVDVLTTGVDLPMIDCVVLLRPTMSAGLYCQMVGRGLRIFPDKKNCLILDFAENIFRHGPIDSITARIKTKRTKEVGNISYQEITKTSVKFCPHCQTACHLKSLECPECSHVFDISEKLSSEASNENILSTESIEEVYDVSEVFYSVHRKPDKPNSFKIEYRINLATSFFEYLCFEHGGYASERAAAAWKLHCIDPKAPVPKTVDEAIFAAEMTMFKNVSRIKIKKDGRFSRVIAWKYAEGAGTVEKEIPPPKDYNTLDFEDDDIPF